MDIEMPIVLPRMRMTYLSPKVEKLLETYRLDLGEVITEGTASAKARFIRAQASDEVLNEIARMREQQIEFYEKLDAIVGESEDNHKLLKKNHQIHTHQYDYLKTRYLKNIERENEISMRHFQILSQTLHPMGGLQERVWNPLQLLNQFGIDMFTSSTFPPLHYTFEQIVIKT